MDDFKRLLKIFDSICITYWGFTIYDLLPKFFTGFTITTFDDTIRVLFAIVGLIYAVARLVNYVIMSRLNNRYREQEIIAKENDNFYKKFSNEFLNHDETKPEK